MSRLVWVLQDPRLSGHYATAEAYLHLWSSKQSRNANQLQLWLLDACRAREKPIHVVNAHVQRLTVHLVYLTNLQFHIHISITYL